MTEKLTLSVPPKFKRKAHLLSRRRKKSISALFVEFVEREAKREKDPFEGLDGVWEGRDITLEQLREKAWSRS
ncbi:MAG: hypothetical protein IT230_05545 [Flavobacteriales bacterium]|nr:hypothetical protein [Flavobacteriales bacterium]